MRSDVGRGVEVMCGLKRNCVCDVGCWMRKRLRSAKVLCHVLKYRGLCKYKRIVSSYTRNYNSIGQVLVSVANSLNLIHRRYQPWRDCARLEAHIILQAVEYTIATSIRSNLPAPHDLFRHFSDRETPFSRPKALLLLRTSTSTSQPCRNRPKHWSSQ